MRKFIICMAVTGLACSAMALNKEQLNDRIRSLTAQFETLQHSDHAVPKNVLSTAKGIVLLDTTKGGFIVAYHGGNGVAMVRNSNGKWSAPAFVKTTGASVGFQAGGEQDFYVVLLMTPAATEKLSQEAINFGAGVGGTAGDDNAHLNASTVPGNAVLVYSQHHGFFGGAAFKGGSLSPDNTANNLYYGRTLAMNQILFTPQVTPTQQEQNLIAQFPR